MSYIYAYLIFTSTVVLSGCYDKAFFYGEDHNTEMDMRSVIIVWNWEPCIYKCLLAENNFEE